MPTVKVFLKGVSKALEFPESTKMEAIEKVVGNWDNVADVKDLPMDTASRMDRARYLGFDVDKRMFHGTEGDVKQFSPSKLGSATGAPSAKQGYFFTDKPNVASDYAELGEGREITALRDKADRWEKIAKRSGRSSDWDKHYRLQELYEDKSINAFDEYGGIVGGSNVIPAHLKPGKEKVVDFKGEAYREETYNSILEKAKRDGYDSVLLKNTIDPANPAFDSTIQDIRVATDPSSIRSTNAAFNPAKKESSNLLASLAGGAVGAGALSANDVEAATNRLLELGKIKQESRVYNIPHPTLNKLGLFLQRGPQSFFTEGVGRGLETLSYGRQNELTDEERRRRAIAVALDFL